MESVSLLWGLFASSVLASTLLPGGSELTLTALALGGEFDHWTILWVATLGNTLGGLSNWVIGYWVSRRYPLQGSKQADRHPVAWRWVQRYGVWTLLLSWLPVIGDPLVLLAGWLRMRFRYVVPLVLLGKGLRYALLLWLVGG